MLALIVLSLALLGPSSIIGCEENLWPEPNYKHFVHVLNGAVDIVVTTSSAGYSFASEEIDRIGLASVSVFGKQVTAWSANCSELSRKKSELGQNDQENSLKELTALAEQKTLKRFILPTAFYDTGNGTHLLHLATSIRGAGEADKMSVEIINGKHYAVTKPNNVPELQTKSGMSQVETVVFDDDFVTLIDSDSETHMRPRQCWPANWIKFFQRIDTDIAELMLRYRQFSSKLVEGF